MDKQKQIEEMAKVILPVVKSFYVTCTDKACDRCIIKRWSGECAAETRSVKIANTYYNAGYRKIPENALVILDEEMEQFAETFAKSPQMQKVMYGLIKEWKKETAEKFAEKLKDEYLPIISAYFTDDEKEEEQGLNYWLCQLTDEICKEITEGKKDGNDGRNV